jgi:hypothetical protein
VIELCPCVHVAEVCLAIGEVDLVEFAIEDSVLPTNWCIHVIGQKQNIASAWELVTMCDMGTKEEVKPNFRTPPR